MVLSNRKSLYLERALYVCFFLCSSIFIYLPRAPGHFYSYSLKAAPIVALVLLVLLAGKKNLRLPIAGGLAFSSLGDVLLSLTIPHHFVLGVIAFLAAQLFYSFGFLKRASLTKLNVLLFLPIIAASLIFITHISQNLGDLKLLLCFYFIALNTMVFSTIFGSSHHHFAILGGLLFMFSDSSILWDRFMEPLPFRNLIVASTYYLAQFLLAHSVIWPKQHKISSRAIDIFSTPA